LIITKNITLKISAKVHSLECPRKVKTAHFWTNLRQVVSGAEKRTKWEKKDNIFLWHFWTKRRIIGLYFVFLL